MAPSDRRRPERCFGALERQNAEQAIELSPEQGAPFLEKLNPCFKERHVESTLPAELLSADTFMVGIAQGHRPGLPARRGRRLRLLPQPGPPPVGTVERLRQSVIRKARRLSGVLTIFGLWLTSLFLEFPLFCRVDVSDILV